MGNRDRYIQVSIVDLKRWQYRPAEESAEEMQYYIDNDAAKE